MQLLLLYNLKSSIATLFLGGEKKKSVSRRPLSFKGARTSRTWYISNVIMCCPVQFSYGLPWDGTQFCCHCKFTRPGVFGIMTWPHVYISLSLSHPRFCSFCLPFKVFVCVVLIHSLMRCFLSVISPMLHKILSAKKLSINLPVFFWVKCKMKYSRTSQGCTSAGFYGNCRAVFSAVVSLRLALCF